jgi:ribosomal protein S11
MDKCLFSFEKGEKDLGINRNGGEKMDKGVIMSTCVYARCTSNNTHITVLDGLGNTIAKISGGQIGKGTKKSSVLAGLVMAEEIGGRMVEKGVKKVSLKLCGFGKGRGSIHRGLRNAGLEIVKVEQENTVAHNGCRGKKIRRL